MNVNHFGLGVVAVLIFSFMFFYDFNKAEPQTCTIEPTIYVDPVWGCEYILTIGSTQARYIGDGNIAGCVIDSNIGDIE